MFQEKVNEVMMTIKILPFIFKVAPISSTSFVASDHEKNSLQSITFAPYVQTPPRDYFMEST